MILHCHDQLVNAVQTNNRCSFGISYDTHKVQNQVFLMLKWTVCRPYIVLISVLLLKPNGQNKAQKISCRTNIVIHWTHYIIRDISYCNIKICLYTAKVAKFQSRQRWTDLSRCTVHLDINVYVHKLMHLFISPREH